MTQQWIGARFVTKSKHPEEAGRTIKLIRQNHAATTPSFVAANIAHPANPALVGRESTISVKTLTSAWRRLEAQADDGDASARTADELLAEIQAEHDEEHPYGHTGCHTLVLLAGIRAVLAACDATPAGRPITTTTIRSALANGMRPGH